MDAQPSNTDKRQCTSNRHRVWRLTPQQHLAIQHRLPKGFSLVPPLKTGPAALQKQERLFQEAIEFTTGRREDSTQKRSSNSVAGYSPSNAESWKEPTQKPKLKYFEEQGQGSNNAVEQELLCRYDVEAEDDPRLFFSSCQEKEINQNQNCLGKNQQIAIVQKRDQSKMNHPKLMAQQNNSTQHKVLQLQQNHGDEGCTIQVFIQKQQKQNYKILQQKDQIISDALAQNIQYKNIQMAKQQHYNTDQLIAPIQNKQLLIDLNISQIDRLSSNVQNLKIDKKSQKVQIIPSTNKQITIQSKVIPDAQNQSQNIKDSYQSQQQQVLKIQTKPTQAAQPKIQEHDTKHKARIRKQSSQSNEKTISSKQDKSISEKLLSNEQITATARTRSQFQANRDHYDKQVFILEKLKSHDFIAPFLTPVNQDRDGAPDYYSIIKQPIDLMTIQTKLKAMLYVQLQDFKEDIEKMWSNSMKYNKNNKCMIKATQQLQKFYRKILNNYNQRAKDQLNSIKRRKKLK